MNWLDQILNKNIDKKYWTEILTKKNIEQNNVVGRLFQSGWLDL